MSSCSNDLNGYNVDDLKAYHVDCADGPPKIRKVIVCNESDRHSEEVKQKAKELGAVIAIAGTSFGESIIKAARHIKITHQYKGIFCNDSKTERDLIDSCKASNIPPVVGNDGILDVNATYIQIINSHKLEKEKKFILSNWDWDEDNEAAQLKRAQQIATDKQRAAILSADGIPIEKRMLIVSEFDVLRVKYPHWKNVKCAKRAGLKYHVQFSFNGKE